MKNLFIRYILWSIFLVIPGIIPVSNLWAAQPIGSGALFPEVPLPAPLESDQRTYLGLVDDQPFTLQQIEGRVALVEILNVHCPHCIRQTKPYSELYDMLEADPETQGKIKIIGVAVANDDEAIDDFVVIYGVHYPIISDHDFKLHSALQAGATPFSLYLLRNQPGENFVVTDTHLGNDYKMDKLFSYLKDLLTINSSDFVTTQAEEAAGKSTLLPSQSEEEISAMIKDTFAAQGNDLNNFHKLDLPSGRRVYTATLTQNGQSQPIFAEVNSRSAICDVCHDVHFFYVF
ncbi:MAG: redoxin family protein, partial [Desulfuromusa sp.]|nr:redoxin family protein [Desulfuromusa sp.]